MNESEQQQLLNELYAKSLQMVKNVNIPCSNDITGVTINRRAKSRWECCRRNRSDGTFKIEITELLLDGKHNDSAINTMIHEILHTADGCKGHNNVWKHYANIIKNQYDIEIKTRSSAEEKGVTRQVKAKYIIKCEKCGQKIYRERQSKLIKHIDAYKCGICGGDLELI